MCRISWFIHAASSGAKVVDVLVRVVAVSCTVDTQMIQQYLLHRGQAWCVVCSVWSVCRVCSVCSVWNRVSSSNSRSCTADAMNTTAIATVTTTTSTTTNADRTSTTTSRTDCIGGYAVSCGSVWVVCGNVVCVTIIYGVVISIRVCCGRR